MIVRIMDISEINAISDVDSIINCDRDYKERIRKIANQIFEERHEKGIILLAGPSGSGKTTTAHMLENTLDAMGAETHTISLDDYFLPFTKEQKELLKEGKVDLESPERLDATLLNEQINDMVHCRPMHLPVYGFEDSTRSYRDEEFCRKDGELVIFEGIHALNPQVILFDEQQLVNLYVSVRTRLRMPDGALLHPSRVRLARRMIRDRLTRARAASETLNMFASVEEGEVKYITPFKNRAKIQIDTFVPYEMRVYAPILHDEIETLPSDNAVVRELKTAFSLLKPCDTEIVPDDSIIREFIG